MPQSKRREKQNGLLRESLHLQKWFRKWLMATQGCQLIPSGVDLRRL